MWMLSCFILHLSISIVKSSVDNLQHPVKSCQIGDVVQNECNKCLCTSKALFECEPLNCNRSKSDIEIEATKEICNPNQLYMQNLITCICTKDGRWPHKSCYETFKSLPPSKVVKYKCDPDSYVPIDCNMCRCGPNGEIVSNRCTKNACEDEVNRRNLGSNSVYSNCEVKNWYSLAPCQFCFCVNQNKLVCNTGNYYSKKLELGSYNLRICGRDLIREAIELIPDNQKILRIGVNNTATTKAMKRASPKSIPKSSKMHEDQNIAIEVNRESNENDTVSETTTKYENFSSSNEYYSDSEEALKVQENNPIPQKSATRSTIPTPVKAGKTVRQELKAPSSTKFPIEEGDEIMLNESNDEEGDEHSSEIELEGPGAFKTTTDIVLHANDNPIDADDNADENPIDNPNDKTVVEIARGANSAESYQYVGNTIKISLPKVLNKVFELALRKSMVSLTKQTKCKPGSTTIHKCNTCFCLKNSKLLCTNNKCSDAIKSIDN